MLLNALALPVALALSAGPGGFSGQCAAPHAQSASASAPVGPKATRTLVVHGQEFDLDAPLPAAPETLPVIHPRSHPRKPDRPVGGQSVRDLAAIG